MGWSGPSSKKSIEVALAGIKFSDNIAVSNC